MKIKEKQIKSTQNQGEIKTIKKYAHSNKDWSIDLKQKKKKKINKLVDEKAWRNN